MKNAETGRLPIGYWKLEISLWLFQIAVAADANLRPFQMLAPANVGSPGVLPEPPRFLHSAFFILP
jgi:hypothetical protein